MTVETWEDLWKLDGHSMKEAGIPVKDRRYASPNDSLLRTTTYVYIFSGIFFGVWRNSVWVWTHRNLRIHRSRRRRFVGECAMLLDSFTFLTAL